MRANSKVNNGKGTRAISIFLIYVLFLGDIISFSNACQGLASDGKYVLNSNGMSFSNQGIVGKRVSQKGRGIEALKTVKRVSGGPGQTETAGFSLNSTDGLVDKFTGDFSYSIPLMDVDGYPVVLKYNSNVSINQDPSWVGLGWDLNLGSVSREMRGIPDEFNGNQSIVRTFNELQSQTTAYDHADNPDGFAFKAGGFVGGGPSSTTFNSNDETYLTKTLSLQLTALVGRYHSSILGQGKTLDIGVQAEYSLYQNDKCEGKTLSLAPTFGIGYHKDSKNGVGISTNFGVSGGGSSKQDGMGVVAGGNFSLGSDFNTRKGMLSRSFTWGADGGSMKTKYKGASGGFGIGSTVMYGTQTFVPRVSVNMIGQSRTINYTAFYNIVAPNYVFSTGAIFENYKVTNQLDITGNTIDQPAFGYLHSGKRAAYYADGKYPIMDFNRTSETAYNTEMKDLPFSVQTYDIFYASGLGMSGTFRARRNDIGTYYDPDGLMTVNKEGNLGDHGTLEFSAGYTSGEKNKITVGISAGNMPGESESGVYKLSNGSNVLEFTSENSSSSFDNATYFKAVGENTPQETAALNLVDGMRADYFMLEKDGKDINLTNQLNFMAGSVDAASVNAANAASTPRPVISTVFTPKTVADFGSGSTYENYPLQGETGNVSQIARSSHDANHISAVEVVSTDGLHYTYGIPMYNLLNDEVSFASEGLTYMPDDLSLITYTAGVDNSVNNQRGWTHYYDKTEIPSYAHSFLLTQMTSSDYVDRQGDGPTLDDVGSYYKFNYSRVYGNTSSDTYKWRFPVSGGEFPEAMGSKALLGSDLDDMAHYTYGEKEIWYAHSIETKNLIAEFVLEDRQDAYGVLGENGVLDTDKPLKLLKKIILYNRAEKLANPIEAVPLQTVVFEYDYSLCPKNPSNPLSYSSNSADYAKSGKLTLKQIRVFSGNSEEMGLASYTFEYSDVNPEFKYSDVDGWGNYKPNDANRPNSIFPYAIQDETQANTNINAYKLKAINNPMGGRIEVAYEADNYGYVQNKRAMENVDITGMMDLFHFLNIQNQSTWSGGDMTANFVTDYEDYSDIVDLLAGNNNPQTIARLQTAGLLAYTTKFGSFDKDFVPNNVLIFRLKEDIDGVLSSAQAADKIRSQYFHNGLSGSNSLLKELYFNMMVNVKPDVKELVHCVATISDDYQNIFDGIAASNFTDDFTSIGVMPKVSSSADYQYGYVILNPANSGSIESVYSGKKGNDANGLLMHPIQRMALDFVRENLPDVIYGSCDGCTTDNDIDNAVGVWGKDMYKYMLKKKNFVPNYLPSSVMRLYDHNNKKYGGNSRVKSITYHDNWHAISNEYNSSYTWNYLYPDRFTSDGVASYEPRAIIKENPFYHWDSYTNFNKHFPDETRFTPTPVADALYPIPVVGYEKVIVQFSSDAAKGYSSSTFHTAKQYPTIEEQTQIDKSTKVIKHNKLTGKSTDLYGFSQGYSVITNDYHGKPDEMTVYNSFNQLQARTTYKYYNQGEQIPMMNREASIGIEYTAMEYDVHADNKYMTDETKIRNFGLAVSFTLPTFIPYFKPTFYKNTREAGYFSSCLIKHFNQSAILKGIETEYLGSINKAENLVYDRFTGNVLLSSLTDEFNDKLYSMSYPSHWYYQNLRDQSGVTLQSFSGTLSNGLISLSGTQFTDIFSPGDVVSVNNGSSPEAWVLVVYPDAVSLINEDGSKYADGTYTIQIKKTNRKNRLDETMQSVVTKKNPYVGGVFAFPSDQIISAGAVSYSTRNTMRCGTPGYVDAHGSHSNNEVTAGTAVNPFKYGVMGDLVMDKQYAWQDERANLNNSIRFNGIYATTFYPFYSYNTNVAKLNWYMVNENSHPQFVSTDANHFQKWRSLGKMLIYDEYGAPLEIVDQLGIRSGIVYGYNSALQIVPVAQAINAPQSNIAFDGFEDYSYYASFPLTNDVSHFDFRSALAAGVSLNTNEHHSGLNSLQLQGGGIAEATRKVDRLCSVNQESGISAGRFIPQQCNCIKPFQPSPDDYLISFWVKEDNGFNKTDYLNQNVMVYLGSSSSPTPLSITWNKGTIVEGWQRIEGTFTIPSTATGQDITVHLENTSSSENVYFDDLRIHPLLAGMTTTVYDPKTLLPMASHDGYNFTTFYNYDENLNMVRVRVETERGIQTVSEQEFGGQKSFESNEVH